MMQLRLFDSYDPEEEFIRNLPTPANDNFLKSQDWLELRYEVIRECGATCVVCGRRATPGNPIQVDHIKPRSTHPWLALDKNNLQVMCRDDNMGKGNRDCIDWRRR
jgi:5-methylcytosine-specific restriction endonuclease McrA